MIELLTINSLPPNERVHALFLGVREGNYGFEVTNLGTVLIPGNVMFRAGGLRTLQKGQDVNLKRDDYGVVVWKIV